MDRSKNTAHGLLCDLLHCTDADLCTIIRSFHQIPEFNAKEFDPYCLPNKVLCDMMDDFDKGLLPCQQAKNIITPPRPIKRKLIINPYQKTLYKKPHKSH